MASEASAACADTPIRIIDGDDALVNYEDAMLNKKNCFLKFLEHFLKRDQTKKAMLYTWYCNEPLARVQIFTTVLIQYRIIAYKLNVETEEIEVSLGTIPRKIMVYDSFGGCQDSWPNYYHEILRISSIKPKEQWVIDIGGAHY
ncbi:metal ion binding [Stemphylium lycopersici]|uniref:Metal ion binding n=1 Tax=Stemphylium lycopersici TaxID=183478 RepID=A0A364N4E4_STELY|nr:hypothetical protein TW65_01614 [Stemphylium lycopersici]RAR02461.1 metal ion binding [Stemphylium lycopersici]RAR11462.1 metal ion binding [Stemphylium lycopersici]